MRSFCRTKCEIQRHSYKLFRLFFTYFKDHIKRPMMMTSFMILSISAFVKYASTSIKLKQTVFLNTGRFQFKEQII